MRRIVFVLALGRLERSGGDDREQRRREAGGEGLEHGPDPPRPMPWKSTTPGIARRRVDFDKGGGWQFGVARLNPDGSPDATFDTDGQATVSFVGASHAYAVAVDSLGRIIVAGSAATTAGSSFSTVDDFVVARLNSGGPLDMTFGSGGRTNVDFSAGDPRSDHAYAMAIQSDGRIVLAGDSVPSPSVALGSFALARLNVVAPPTDGGGGGGTDQNPGKGPKGRINFFYGLNRRPVTRSPAPL
ncbi:hypothetical protein [Paludisphaera mucosa]|uniref:Uncharacterized protein n=1 Tax=Paludisphaera mucosa TaxID=3030827 RepID=A0ABT6FDB3_9BACT|nr:hypothetical protein [Paludisphaera mucosa]MDG3005550.1 hypothetical protein [Paludisphaera mucosa]